MISLPDLLRERGRGSLVSNVTWETSARRHGRRAVVNDFESIHQLQFIKSSSLRPSRILLHSLEGFGIVAPSAFELERLARPRAIFTTRHPLRHSRDVRYQAPPPSFSRVCWWLDYTSEGSVSHINVFSLASFIQLVCSIEYLIITSLRRALCMTSLCMYKVAPRHHIPL